jgi:hypothetical protein
MTSAPDKVLVLRSRLAVFVAIACIAIDRFSYGFGGGESIGRNYVWQIPVASVLVVLLVVALIADARTGGASSAGRFLLRLEFVGFVAYNLLLLVRDGLGRLLWNFEHAPIGLALIVVGLGARLFALRGTASSAIDPA